MKEVHGYDHATSTEREVVMNGTATALFPDSLSIIPCSSNKRPTKLWKESQSRRLPYEAGADLYGIVCGDISGNLECIDFDAKNCDNPDLIRTAFEELVAMSDPELFALLAIQKTPSGGRHYVYRVEGAQVKKCKVLAKTKGKVVFETRGEGGYFCTAGPYGWLQHSPHSIPTITAKQQALLARTATTFGDAVPEAKPRHTMLKKDKEAAQSIFDRFDQEADPVAMLQERGWTIASQRSGVTYLRRPGKTDGLSATYNFPTCSGRVYVFTTSTELEAGRSYKPSQLVAFLDYGGDFRAAARALAAVATNEQAGKGCNDAITLHGSDTKLELFTKYSTARRHTYRFNVLSQRHEWSCGGEEWQEIDDRAVNTWALEIEESARKHISPKNIWQYLETFRLAPPYDPICEYFDGLLAWNEDDGDVIADYCDLLPTHNPELTRSLIRSWLVAVYKQAYYGGKVNELFLVLVGKQGTGKTTWLRRLVPAPLAPYKYEGALPDTKDTTQRLSGSWLAINDELAGLRKSETEYLKQLLSRENFQYRAPYAHAGTTATRRVSFAGSTNENTFLADGTGNRRFVPIELVEKGDVQAMLTFNADRLWSHVRHLADSGCIAPFLSAEQEEALEGRRAMYECIDPVIEIVSRYFLPATSSEASNVEWMSAHELIEAAYDEHFGSTKGPRPHITQREMQIIGRWLGKAGSVKKSQRLDANQTRQRWCVVRRQSQGSKEEQDDIEYLDTT